MPSARKQSRQRRGRSLPVAIDLARVDCKEVRWLWPGRIPLGKLTLLAGDPELGKSFLTIDIAARVTCGLPWPDRPDLRAPEGEVILLNAEDDIEDTICPRLMKAGARLDRCTALSATRSEVDGLVRPIALDCELEMLRELLQRKTDCRLLVIDPIGAYLGNADGNNNQEVRELLFPLSQLAAEFNIAVLVVTHLNKKESGRSLYRSLGSLAFVAVARTAWMVVRDPEVQERILMLPAKNNLGCKAAGLAYCFKADSPQAVAALHWDARPVSLSLDLLMASSSFNRTGQDYRDEEHYADTWLREELSDGPRKRGDLFNAIFRPIHISDQQTYRASERLGVLKLKSPDWYEGWLWALPEHEARAREMIEKRTRKRKPKRRPKGEADHDRTELAESRSRPGSHASPHPSQRATKDDRSDRTATEHVSPEAASPGQNARRSGLARVSEEVVQGRTMVHSELLARDPGNADAGDREHAAGENDRSERRQVADAEGLVDE